MYDSPLFPVLGKGFAVRLRACRLTLLWQASVARPSRAKPAGSKAILSPEVTGDGGGCLVERNARSEKLATDSNIDFVPSASLVSIGLCRLPVGVNRFYRLRGWSRG